MPAIDDDEIKIQHCLPGRPQSPALERTARLAIEAALGELISRKLLYQKVTIDLSALSQALGSPELTTPDQLSLLETEVAARPWELETHHQGDNPIHLPIFASANVGGQPIGTPLLQVMVNASWLRKMEKEDRKLFLFSFPLATLGNGRFRRGLGLGCSSAAC